jgi:ABC-type dipeptide/oligopeptide/nickel transport system permease subunit
MKFYRAFMNSSTVDPLFLISPLNNPGANSLWFGTDKVGRDS